MYQPAISWRDGKPIMTRSTAYNNWCKYFPIDNLDGYDHIDFDKRVGLWLRLDLQERFDVDDCIKSFQDMLCSYYDADDNNVEIMEATINEYVTTYQDGKIYFILKNLD